MEKRSMGFTEQEIEVITEMWNQGYRYSCDDIQKELEKRCNSQRSVNSIRYFVSKHCKSRLVWTDEERDIARKKLAKAKAFLFNLPWMIRNGRL